MLPSQSEPRVHGISRILGDVAVVHLIELRIIIKRPAINLEEGVVVSTYHTVGGCRKAYCIQFHVDLPVRLLHRVSTHYYLSLRFSFALDPQIGDEGLIL